MMNIPLIVIMSTGVLVKGLEFGVMEGRDSWLGNLDKNPHVPINTTVKVYSSPFNTHLYDRLGSTMRFMTAVTSVHMFMTHLKSPRTTH